MINNYLGLPFYPPCLKIDHCNRRVDGRISRILIKHDIQATKSMFGLSQSNLCCVVVFIPRLCMMAELLVPAPSPTVCCVPTPHCRGEGTVASVKVTLSPLPVSQSGIVRGTLNYYLILKSKISCIRISLEILLISLCNSFNFTVILHSNREDF